MGSLATGSVKFATIIYENPPALVDELATTMRDLGIKPEVEIFDLALLYNARALVDRGLLRAPAPVQFVMGIPHALPVREKLLAFLEAELGEMLPGSPRTAAGLARPLLTDTQLVQTA